MTKLKCNMRRPLLASLFKKPKAWTLWGLEGLLRTIGGALWILGPSLIIFNIGMSTLATTGWTIANVQIAATNAFIIWVSVHVLFVFFDRYMHRKIVEGIEKYHVEFNDLRQRWIKMNGPDRELDSIGSLKEKIKAHLEARGYNL